MTAICCPPAAIRRTAGRRVPGARPRPGARPSPAQLRRRRVTVALAVAVLLGAVVVCGVPGGATLSPSGRAPAAAEPAGALPIAARAYVVHPGDTLWSIARTVQPAGDVRPLVQRLADARGGAPLRVGERLALPPPSSGGGGP